MAGGLPSSGCRRLIPPVSPDFDEPAILRIERPHASLWTYYLLNALAIFPAAPVLLPYFWFRYNSMRYRFTEIGRAHV